MKTVTGMAALLMVKTVSFRARLPVCKFPFISYLLSNLAYDITILHISLFLCRSVLMIVPISQIDDRDLKAIVKN